MGLHSLLIPSNMIAFISLTLTNQLLIMSMAYHVSAGSTGITQRIGSISMFGFRNERRQKLGEISKNGLNLTEWEENTEKECIKSFESKKDAVSNPSGMALCYNLPFLNQESGVFEADLRLFILSRPTGSFDNVPNDKIQVALSFDGVSVSSIDKTSLKVRDNSLEFSPVLMKSKLRDIKRETTPKLMENYAFVGQVDKSLMPLNSTGFRKVLTPSVSLKAVDSTGAEITASLDSDEMLFVNGVFASKADPMKTLLAQPIQTLVVAPDSPFIVPGLNILIFPIGLVITSIWTVAFISTIGYGTTSRIQHREKFRESQMKEVKGAFSSI